MGSYTVYFCVFLSMVLDFFFFVFFPFSDLFFMSEYLTLVPSDVFGLVSGRLQSPILFISSLFSHLWQIRISDLSPFLVVIYVRLFFFSPFFFRLRDFRSVMLHYVFIFSSPFLLSLILGSFLYGFDQCRSFLPLIFNFFGGDVVFTEIHC